MTLLLEELSYKQGNGLKAYFKGGTAIYKILNSLKRFSEDIDLTIDTTGKTSEQLRKDLKHSTKEYASIEFDMDLIINKSSRTSTFKYPSLFDIDSIDQLNRFGLVKIESTNFTISEPIEKHVIVPLIYTLANQSDKEILEKEYELTPFSIMTLSLKRMFIDKYFALENRLIRKEYLDAGKHAYDICQLIRLDEIKSFLKNREELALIIDIQVSEERVRLNSSIQNIQPVDFKFELIYNQDSTFINEFINMQKIYVFTDNDKLEFYEVIETLKVIRVYLLAL